MTIHHETLTGTASAGALSVNTRTLSGSLLRNILVKPATETTVYDLTITNDRSIIMFELLSETGTLSQEVALPVRGVYTVAIANATADEAFTIQLVSQE
jgi:hypothetical protein